MEEKNKMSKKARSSIIINIILMLIVIAGILMIPAMMKDKTIISKITDDNKLEAYNSNGRCGDFEAKNPNSFYIPTVAGRQIFCIEKGKAVKFSLASVSYISKYGSLYNENTVGMTRNGYCGCPSTPDDGLASNTYYMCTGDHFTPGDDVAYIVTTRPLDEWTVIKQQAIWRSSISERSDIPMNGPAPEGIHNDQWQEGVELIKEAKQYEEFHKATKSSGLNAKDKTDYEELKVNPRYNEKDFTVGPFKMNYEKTRFQGIGGDIAFGGVSDMYIIGNITKRIEIQSFILIDPVTKEEKEVSPRYFTPDEDLTDRGVQNYPEPGQEFYVKFRKPITDDNKGRDEVDQNFYVHVDFKYLTIDAYACRLRGVQYTVNWSHSHTKHTHQCCHGSGDDEWCHTVSCYNCTARSRLSQSHHQDLVDSNGVRSLLPDKLEMPFDIDDIKKIDITMELGGHVWEDEKENKESIPDGRKNGKEDYKKGVEVILYEKNGKEVDRTVTGSDGKYLFKKLDALKKYYVEFIYDGQLYEHTKYTSNLSGGYSNATETPSERDRLNDKFSEIGSTPQNYKVKRSLYYSVGSWNKTYPRENKEFKAIYQEVIDAAADLKSYSKAYSKVLRAHGSSEETKRMLQYIEDCRISAYTGSAGKDHIKYYPVVDNFIIRDRKHKIIGIDYDALYEDQRRIDFGITRRQDVDLAIRTDVYNTTLEINGKTQVYEYDKRKNLEDKFWDISARLSDASYYKQSYTRELYRSDYAYRTSMYEANSLNTNIAGINLDQNKELKVFVTYRITVRNQSQSIMAQLRELVSYYDQDYQYEADRSYIGDVNGRHISPIKATTNTRYGNGTLTSLRGYDRIFIQGLEDKKLATGEDAYIFITFSVKKDSGVLRLDENEKTAARIGVGKEFVSEINGYATFYRDNTKMPNGETKGSGNVAGLVDIDSNPGNLDPNDVPKDGDIKYKNFEDDTDKAPNIRLILYRDHDRTLDGFTWEDIRNVQATDVNGNRTQAQIGNGIYNKSEGDTIIDGVTVQLVELIKDKNNSNNTVEYIWKEYKTGQRGTLTPVINRNDLVSSYDIGNQTGLYKFISFAPGNYIIRFKYGDGRETVLSSSSSNSVSNLYKASGQAIGQNNKSYNGQDFKTTTYQTGINQNSAGYVGKGYTNYNDQNERGTYTYDFVEADRNSNVSDAKDIMSIRNYVNNYSSTNVTNYKAEVLASPYSIPNYSEVNYSYDAMKRLVDEFTANTQMRAETGIMNVEMEYNTAVTGNQGENNKTTYAIANVNLGLEERPKAQLKTNTQVVNVRVLSATQEPIFDAIQQAPNVVWLNHIGHGPDTTNTYVEANNYDKRMMKNPIVRKSSTEKGFIQLNMDERLMQGATIQVTYTVMVANIGEVDYRDNTFYYTGKVRDTATLVKTTINEVVDYIGTKYDIIDTGDKARNNLQFVASDNPDWAVITKEELFANGDSTKALVNNKLTAQVGKYNTILKNEAIRKDLVPVIVDRNAQNIANQLKQDPMRIDEYVKNNVSSVASSKLVLTQVISPGNSSDDLAYNNMVEIVKTSNIQGRRNNYSVAGNQDPTKLPTEIDADATQEAQILPPTGQTYIYYILGIGVAIILIAGIIFIQKKVIRKKKE